MRGVCLRTGLCAHVCVYSFIDRIVCEISMFSLYICRERERENCVNASVWTAIFIYRVRVLCLCEQLSPYAHIHLYGEKCVSVRDREQLSASACLYKCRCIYVYSQGQRERGSREEKECCSHSLYVACEQLSVSVANSCGFVCVCVQFCSYISHIKVYIHIYYIARDIVSESSSLGI